VLVVRVHQLAETGRWARRYEFINDFEKLAVLDSETKILKFFLHISKKEQLARFKQRLDDPERRWKISEADYRERAYWTEYSEAFQDMLRMTSTPHAPWFIIPSNNKWFRNLAVTQIITRALENLDMSLPEPGEDIVRMARLYHSTDEQ
jgi:polyphosphate kinase 2 (PPK2 family)